MTEGNSRSTERREGEGRWNSFSRESSKTPGLSCCSVWMREKHKSIAPGLRETDERDHPHGGDGTGVMEGAVNVVTEKLGLLVAHYILGRIYLHAILMQLKLMLNSFIS